MTALWSRALPLLDYLTAAGWDRVKKFADARTDRSGDCWTWTGSLDRKGYGRACIDGRFVLAHRVAWVLRHRREPGSMLVCHTCDNPRCVNPDHLWLGTNDDNQRDKRAKRRNRCGDRKGINNPNYRHGRCVKGTA